MGRYSDLGWVWYFPFAFLVKSPVALIALGVWAGVVLVRRARAGKRRDLLILLPASVFVLAALGSSLNVGERHVLPAYAFLFIAAGAVVTPGSFGPPARRWIAAGALTTLSGIESLSSAPYFLTHFNVPARLFAERDELLVDSNLDWGQDLARLKSWMDRHEVREIKLAYFGTASPRRLKLEHQALPAFNTYREFEKEWKEAGPLAPGDVVAVSCTAWAGTYDPDRSRFRRLLGSLKPVTVIGNSIRVYRLPQDAK